MSSNLWFLCWIVIVRITSPSLMMHSVSDAVLRTRTFRWKLCRKRHWSRRKSFLYMSESCLRSISTPPCLKWEALVAWPLCLRFITGSGKSQETLQAQPAGINVTDVQSAPHTQTTIQHWPCRPATPLHTISLTFQSSYNSLKNTEYKGVRQNRLLKVYIILS